LFELSFANGWFFGGIVIDECHIYNKQIKAVWSRTILGLQKQGAGQHYFPNTTASFNSTLSM